MSTLVLIVILLCSLLPSRYVVAALPALWMIQNVFLMPNAALVHAGPVDILPVDLVLISLLLRCALGIAAKKQFVADTPLYAAILIFLAVNFVATLAAGVKFGEGQFLHCLTSEARLVAEIALVPVLACAITTLPQARRCIGILLATLAALAAIQFINFFGASHGITIGEVQGIERGEVRCFGPVGDSVGFVLLLGYVASLRFASIGGAGACLGGILLTAGIGSIFAAGVGTVLFLIFGTQSAEVRAFARRRLWLLPLLAFAGLAGLALFARPMAQTLLDRLSSRSYESSGGQRLATATLAGAMIADNPLLGVGYMGYEPVLAHYGGARLFDLAHPDGGMANANNQILQALTDSGVCGLLAVAALIVCAARLLRRVAGRCEDQFVSTFFLSAFIWLLALVFGNLAAVWLNPSSFIARFFWIILGAAVAVQRLLPAETEDRPIPQESPRLVPA